MKQSELNKVFNKNIKNIGKMHGWKSKGGFLFAKKNLLFFSLILLPQAKNNTIHYCLDYKYFEFDEVFWNIVNMPENKNQPLSFHAAGAFSAPTMRIKDEIIRIEDWTGENIEEKVKYIISEMDKYSSEIASNIRTVDENLLFIETLYDEIKDKYPKTGKTTFIEMVITCLLKNDLENALEIVNNRIAQKDSGGFIIEGETFYSLAKQYIENISK